jgi:hypothetical protein
MNSFALRKRGEESGDDVGLAPGAVTDVMDAWRIGGDEEGETDAGPPPLPPRRRRSRLRGYGGAGTHAVDERDGAGSARGISSQVPQRSTRRRDGLRDGGGGEHSDCGEGHVLLVVEVLVHEFEGRRLDLQHARASVSERPGKPA